MPTWSLLRHGHGMEAPMPSPCHLQEEEDQVFAVCPLDEIKKFHLSPVFEIFLSV